MGPTNSQLKNRIPGPTRTTHHPRWSPHYKLCHTLIISEFLFLFFYLLSSIHSFHCGFMMLSTRSQWLECPWNTLVRRGPVWNFEQGESGGPGLEWWTGSVNNGLWSLLSELTKCSDRCGPDPLYCFVQLSKKCLILIGHAPSQL